MLRIRTSFVTIVSVAALAVAAAASGQVTKMQTVVKHRPTFVDADLAKVAKYVGELNSRTFELELGVCGLVTARWDKAQTPQELYGAFVEIAQDMGYVVVEEGVVTKIQLAADVPRDPTPPCRSYPVRPARN